MHLYGGDQYEFYNILYFNSLLRYAMKAAAHELKSVIRYYGNDGIYVPLMALVSFSRNCFFPKKFL